ncbi:MAG: hypothetical protein QOE92_225, partial [Chloroflexota bacterium]|nr:hypothetical protein [Chloroflexota bacterium]
PPVPAPAAPPMVAEAPPAPPPVAQPPAPPAALDVPPPQATVPTPAPPRVVQPYPQPPAGTPAQAPATAPVEAGTPSAGGIRVWWAAGERVEVEVPAFLGRTNIWEIFTRVFGAGPWLTMLHGFPTSSWDWEKVSALVSARNRLLIPDLLGFGDSDKPWGHDWSAFEQADIIEALWQHYEVTETRVIAHDVGMTVALELMARQEEGRLRTRITDFTLLNGGVYAGFHRPRPIQVWLQRPVVGALIARRLSEARFGPSLAEIFGPAHQPTADELHQHWLAVEKREGGRNYHRLIKYIPERRANAPRWEGALEKTTTPIRFVWGMADPVSGAHMVQVIRERRPGADIVELADVGHYPQLEAPEEVARALLR